ALLLAACGSAAPSAETPAEARIPLRLERTPLREIAAYLVEEARANTVVSSQLDPFADCISVSASAPEPVSIDEAVTILRVALADSGIDVQHREGVVRFALREGADPPACGTQAETTAPAEPDDVVARFRQGVRQTGPREWLLRSDAAALLRTGATLDTVRLVPQENTGIRLYGISRESLLSVLGLANEDLIRTVNGTPMTTPEAALEAYSQLRRAIDVVVHLERNGEPLTFRYRVVDRFSAGP
ncbi:MAG: hypothetical protein AAGE52_23885, partial [Myxococcota bacterium]